MSKKIKAITTTANTGAPSAAEKAAKKPEVIRKEVGEFVTAIESAQKSLAKVLFEAALWCRNESASKAELDELLSVVDRRRRSDFRTIAGAPTGLIEQRSCPKNLIQSANYVRARNKGASAALAKSFAEQKMTAGQLSARLKAEPEAEKPATPPKAGNGAETLPAPKAAAVGNLKRLLGLLPALEAEMAEYGPECKQIMAALTATVHKLSVAAAKG